MIRATRILKNNRGNLIMSVAVVAAICMLAAVAIEFSAAVLTQNDLQKYLDAAVYKALQANANSADVMGPGTTPQDAIKYVAFKTLVANVVAEGKYPLGWVKGLPPDSTTGIAKLTKDSMILKLTFEPGKPIFITAHAKIRKEAVTGGFIPGFKTIDIYASSSAQRRPAYVSLVLDVSGSMLGPKLQALKEASKSFASFFTVGYDQLAVVKVTDKAEVVRPMKPISADVATYIDSITSAAGATNLGDGVHLA